MTMGIVIVASLAARTAPEYVAKIRSTFMLTSSTANAVARSSREEGVRLAQERHPSLVLMDIRLPGIDGIEALRRLRVEQSTRGIPVMAMTASVMTADRQKITDAGFDAFQSKPLKVSDSIAAVERLLDHHGKRAERRHRLEPSSPTFWEFVHDHRTHGTLTGKASEPAWDGYLLTVACS